MKVALLLWKEMTLEDVLGAAAEVLWVALKGMMASACEKNSGPDGDPTDKMVETATEILKRTLLEAVKEAPYKAVKEEAGRGEPPLI